MKNILILALLSLTTSMKLVAMQQTATRDDSCRAAHEGAAICKQNGDNSPACKELDRISKSDACKDRGRDGMKETSSRSGRNR